MLAGALGLFGIAVVAWAIFVNDPLGGEPTAVVATGVPTKTPAGGRPAPPRGRIGQGPRSSATAPTDKAMRSPPAYTRLAPPPGSKTITIIDGSSGKHQDVIIPGKPSDLAPKAPADRRLLELTVTAPSRRSRPTARGRSSLYAHPRKLPAGKTDAPRIAIIVGGLGISATGTAEPSRNCRGR